MLNSLTCESPKKSRVSSLRINVAFCKIPAVNCNRFLHEELAGVSVML